MELPSIVLSLTFFDFSSFNNTFNKYLDKYTYVLYVYLSETNNRKATKIFLLYRTTLKY